QPYGQQPYGQQTSFQTMRDPDKRPGTVTAASIITIVMSTLTFLLFAIVTIALLVARDDVIDEIDNEMADTQGLEDFSADDLASFITIIMLVFVVWCLAAIVLAVLAMRRQGWARITVIISAAMAALISLLGITSLISGITLIAAIAVIVLYFTGGANDWYAKRGHQPQLPTGTTQPWG
ncbi:MAG: hypothetical protein WKF79_14665, partial [Nocardioides sp.]